MKEVFAKPCAAAIIEKTVDGETYLLLQTRQKENSHGSNGLLEIPVGKIREYENIFDALRREVCEETDLAVTEIQGEQDACHTSVNGCEVISFAPYCTTQNLTGIYSIIVHTFLCRAAGTLLLSTNETVAIHREKASDAAALLAQHPERFFPMHILALRKYLGVAAQ